MAHAFNLNKTLEAEADKSLQVRGLPDLQTQKPGVTK